MTPVAHAAKTRSSISQKRAAGNDVEVSLRQRIRELDSVNALGAKVCSTLSASQVVKFAVREVSRLVRPDVAMLQIRSGDELILKETYPRVRKFQQVGRGLHPVGQCLCGLSAALRQPLFSGDIRRDIRCTMPECKAAGIRSFAALPLMNRRRVLGVLGVASVEPRDFEQHAAFLQAVGAQVSIALQNALWYEQEREHGRALEREVKLRRSAERKLRQANATLERRVRERTELAERRATQLQSLAAKLTQTEHKERERIAQVLHEEVQQLLAAAKFRAAVAAGEATAYGLRNIKKSCRAIDQAISVCRSLTVELFPPVLYDMGLIAALQWQARRLKSQQGLDVQVQAEVSAQPKSQAVRAFLFESAKELLFNVVKHAGVKSANVRLSRAGRFAVLEVLDHGTGIRPAAAAASETSPFGLISISERAGVFGGKLEIKSSAGKGTHARLTIPMSVKQP